MPNRNYLRGYNIEKKAQELLESEGYVTARTAGSHSPFDVVAVRADKIRLIQIKRVKKFSKSILEKAKKEILLCPKAPGVVLEVWIYCDRKGFIVKEAL